MLRHLPTSSVMRFTAVGLVLFCCLDGLGAEGPKKSSVPGETAQRQASQLIADVEALPP